MSLRIAAAALLLIFGVPTYASNVNQAGAASTINANATNAVNAGNATNANKANKITGNTGKVYRQPLHDPYHSRSDDQSSPNRTDNNTAKRRTLAKHGHAHTLDALLDQNIALTKGALNEISPFRQAWPKLSISAKLTVDGGGSSKKPTNGSFGRYAKGISSNIALTHIILYGDAWLNPMLTAHLAMIYADNRRFYQIYDHDNGLIATPLASDGYANPDFTRQHFQIDEGYVRLAGFMQSPIFVEVGRFYMPFSNYELHPLTETLPQQLAQTQATAFQMGYAAPLGPNNGGLAFSVYTFRDSPQPIPARRRHAIDFGAQAVYGQETGLAGFRVGLGFLYDMNDINFIATTPVGIASPRQDFKEVHGLAADALGHLGPFDGHMVFVTALEQFSRYEVAYRGHGAEPKAFDMGAGYSFQTFNHNSRLGLSYQHSWQASRLGLGALNPGSGLPKDRVQSDYTINVFYNTQIQTQLRWDKDYNLSEGGTNKDAITGLIRVAVAFG